MSQDFLSQVDYLLLASPDFAAVAPTILAAALTHFASETGAIHRLDPGQPLLHLVAHAGLPPQLLAVVQTIPVGKGIAGQTLAQRRPVSICNLQTDTSGVARPAARQTGVGGAICVPIWVGQNIVGTFGLGTRRDCEYSPAQVHLLEEVARRLGTRF